MEIDCATLYYYLQGGTYPPQHSDNQKRAIRTKAKKFTLKDGVLHYVQSGGDLMQWIANTHHNRRLSGYATPTNLEDILEGTKRGKRQAPGWF